LVQASDIIKQGYHQLNERIEKDRIHLQDLFSFYQHWLLKPAAVATTGSAAALTASAAASLTAPKFIDLAYPGSLLYPTVLVNVMRYSSRFLNNEIELVLPQACTYGFKSIPVSQLLPQEQIQEEDKKSIVHSILKDAQASVFNLELFELVRC